ncbi:riboflavin synthase [Desulfonatronovibrio magnus]|uniref:riboflavin synthase n=1 Tax=Desulfonatronovibrio magnus TaxID=698827 RepID=UPI0005EBB40D|nr:riboflavin synthase [Desulfonatronovibrio magnus]
MFTGLIQTTGTVSGIESRGTETRMRLVPAKALSNLELGESIAVNGVCLTVEDFGQDWFYVYASSQTMGLTNLKALKLGHKVNLERALRMGDRLGGHLVSGHVDCQARISGIAKSGESVIYTLSFPDTFSRQIIDKGSVALDGISLTVIECGQEFLKVNIIPATQKETTINSWTMGTHINMETDIIGKYVEKMLSVRHGHEKVKKPESKISNSFLHEHGFL